MPIAVDAYDVIWNSPSADSAGSMPIGNGEVVINTWVEDKTGDLLFLIGRTDSLSEISRMLKLGRVRVHFSGAGYGVPGAGSFTQRLHLRDGQIEIATPYGNMNVFVDSGANVIHVTGKFKQPVQVKASVECWRNEARTIPKGSEEQGSAWSVHDAPFPLTESADNFVDERGLPSSARGEGAVVWFHRNETSVVPKLWENQSLTGLQGTFDPLIHRTFGGRLAGHGLTRLDDRSVGSKEPSLSLDLTVATYTAQTNTAEDWIRGVEAEAEHSPTREAEARTTNWWHSYWDRSWVVPSGHDPDVASIARGYLLQRFVQGCQGRGEYPIKFNGGTYTVEPAHMGKPFDPDYRSWGDSHWYQNVRHMYHPMLASGDLEMMEPFFRLYEKARPLAESRTKLYHHCEGAYFPETMTVFGTYSGGDYGWNRAGLQPKDVECPWWQFAWNQGPELVALMLDRWDYSRDPRFLRERVLPMAASVLRYFDTRFKKDSAGRIVLDPTQSVETYWTGVKNDMPSTAGLIAITGRLCELPKGLVNDQDRRFFEHMRGACPELPLQTVERGGAPTPRPLSERERELAPAQTYDPHRSNVENPELYAVWPFQVVSLAHPKLLEEARRAYTNRHEHLDVGWGYDGNAAALLGLSNEGARILTVKCANSHKGYRWPATWGPNFDWLPDQNHGGNLLETTHLMLLQAEPLEAGGAIRILPAWPKKWDVDFKLHAPGNTTVRCRAAGGKILELEVTPAARAKDVIWPAGWDCE